MGLVCNQNESLLVYNETGLFRVKSVQMVHKKTYSREHSLHTVTERNAFVNIPVDPDHGFWYPHLFTKGGSARPPAISKTVAPINLKFCRVLETSFNVVEMLKLFA